MIEINLAAETAKLNDGEWQCDHKPTLQLLNTMLRLDPISVSQGDPDSAILQNLIARIPSVKVVSNDWDACSESSDEADSDLIY